MASTRISDRLVRAVLFITAIACQQAKYAEAAGGACWKDTPCDSQFTETAFPGPWEANILAPASRTITPKSIVVLSGPTTSGDVIPVSRSPFDPAKAPLLLKGNGSQLVFDFGQEVGGLVTLRYTVSRGDGSGDLGGSDDDGDNDGDDGNSDSHSSREQRLTRKRRRPSSLGLAFAESIDFIGEWSDASNGAFQGPDGAIYAELGIPEDDDGVAPSGKEQVYTMPDASLRGGFRYLTVFLMVEDETEFDTESKSKTAITLHNVTLDLSFQPTWPNLRAYQGYFDCDDPLLNRIWYAGAYTLQTNAVPPDTGRRVPFLKRGWANDGLLGPGHTILVDGAKRDRAVWPGDMGVAVPSLFVSTGDMESVKNALQTMYDNQNQDGSFPEAGPPLLQQGSDTYHMWTMVGTYNYVLYTNDTAFLARNWAGYRHAMAYITAKQADGAFVSPDAGLLHVTGVRDWARLDVGSNMTEAQVILYRTLTTGAWLADLVGSDAATATSWTAAAERLRNATLAYCYDTQAGLFRDNAAPSTMVYPQDANALALAFGMTAGGYGGNNSSGSKSGVIAGVDLLSANISAHLVRNWLSAANPYPVTPELPGHVSPFISSWEVRGHLVAGETDRALDLIRAVWGRYLDRPDGSQSTAVEGLLLDGDDRATFGYRWNRGYGGAHNDTAVAASYTSHSHGWSAGPTSALAEFVLGLSVTGVAGSTWQFAPQIGGGGLRRAEGGFVTALGKFQARWTCSCCCTNGSCSFNWNSNGNSSNTTSFAATVNTPPGTSGVFVLPVPGRATTQGAELSVVLNDTPIHVQDHRLQHVGSHTSKTSALLLHVQGGRHTVTVSRVSI